MKSHSHSTYPAIKNIAKNADEYIQCMVNGSQHHLGLSRVTQVVWLAWGGVGWVYDHRTTTWVVPSHSPIREGGKGQVVVVVGATIMFSVTTRWSFNTITGIQTLTTNHILYKNSIYRCNVAVTQNAGNPARSPATISYIIPLRK